ncbi:MAG: hypothetical protein JWQ60_5394 [Pseudonocardia sp.]|jgi:hypothetical protein|nr:hypothetical protein [Pseudonocardia sp.]
MSAAMQDRGLAPTAVAEHVLDAIRANQFFVLPHATQALAAVRRRLRRMTDEVMPWT